MSIRKMYNALTKLGRRILMKTNKLPRDILLIILVVVLTAFGGIVPSILTAKWSYVSITWYSLILLALLFMIFATARSIQRIDQRELSQQKEDNKKLIEDIAQATAQATIKALIEQGVIKKQS